MAFSDFTKVTRIHSLTSSGKLFHSTGSDLIKDHGHAVVNLPVNTVISWDVMALAWL